VSVENGNNSCEVITDASHCILIRWVPGHSDIDINDHLSRRGCGEDHKIIPESISYHKSKMTLRTWRASLENVTTLKMDRAKAKWRVELQNAFNGQRASRPSSYSVVLTIHHHSQQTSTAAQKQANRYCSFSLSSPPSVKVCTLVYIFSTQSPS
jgi:hypothetical protein